MPAKHFNDLSPAEAERLALLAEECAEVVQVVGKILRHGYESHHPERPEETNRHLLEKELGHVMAAKELMYAAEDISGMSVVGAKLQKLSSVGKWLHHAAD